MIRKLVLCVWMERNSKSTEWKQLVGREKKIRMKIIRGKEKVKWVKRREGQISELK